MSNRDYYTKTFIIIPAYNEKTSISKVLEDLSTLRCSIVVVDDGSLDDIKEEVKKYKQVIYLRHKVNLGQGAAWARFCSRKGLYRASA